MKALVIGSSIIDIVCKFGDRINNKNQNLILKLGSKYNLELIEFSVGGSALNVACDLSNLGNKVSLISRIGNDVYGDKIRETLERYKVKPLLKVDRENTGFSVILLKDGEKIVLISKGSSDNISEKDIEERYIVENDVIIVTSCGKNSRRIYEKVFNLCRKYRKIFVFNPSISVIRKERRLLDIFKSDRAELIILNDEEAKSITKKENLNQAAKKLLKHFKRVIVTLGEKGSIYYDDENKIYQKAYRVKVVSTIGAGDSFTAGFVHYFFKTRDIKASLNFASAYAAINVSSFGSIVEAKEKDVLNFMKNFK